MSASTTATTPPNDVKKKRGKAAAPASTSAPASDAPTGSEPTTTNGTGPDFPFVRELQKTLRNTTKKLNATAKVDAIVNDNPGKSLDELVAEKKINTDQKAQVVKKPALQATIAQIEEQLAQFKQYGAYYEERLASQKAELEKTQEELDAAKKKAAEAAQSAEDRFGEGLLVLTRFLCAAAAVRVSGDATSNDSRAFEGALLQVYGGNDDAVSAMRKLIEGTDDRIPSTDGELLDVTYQSVKQVAVEYIPRPPENTWTGETATTETAASADPSLQTTDPTMASAGMTELQDSSIAAQATATNGHSAPLAPAHDERPPSQAMVNGGAANPLAQANWEGQTPISLSTATTGEWVDVQAPGKQPVPLDTAGQGPPPPIQAQSSWDNSWAEDIPTGSEAAINGSSAQSGEGFEQVVHHTRQGSGRGRGGFRGRGPRGDGFRGRGGGFRGDFRGRGRGRGGEHRGGRGRGGHPSQAGSGSGTPPMH